MKRPVLALAAAAAVSLASVAHAADLVVIASNGVKGALEELAPRYEHASGNKLSFKWGGAAAAQKVASGQVDLGALLINEIMAQPGVEVAGPLPAELQTYTAFSSGVATASKNAAAAKALVDHLRSPDARAAFKAKGQEPG